MVHHLAENGTMAVVLPHGVLFRGGAEGHIRKFLIENRNYLDAVIGLPANLFYGTSIPTAILVFKKCRDTPETVLFIEASNSFEKVKTQNYLREEDIETLFETYKNRTDLEKYSRNVPLTEIAENDYNLNIPRYIDTFEAEEAVDLSAVARELQDLENQIAKADKDLAVFCEELEILKPF